MTTDIADQIIQERVTCSQLSKLLDELNYPDKVAFVQLALDVMDLSITVKQVRVIPEGGKLNDSLQKVMEIFLKITPENQGEFIEEITTGLFV